MSSIKEIQGKLTEEFRKVDVDRLATTLFALQAGYFARGRQVSRSGESINEAYLAAHDPKERRGSGSILHDINILKRQIMSVVIPILVQSRTSFLEEKEKEVLRIAFELDYYEKGRKLQGITATAIGEDLGGWSQPTVNKFRGSAEEKIYNEIVMPVILEIVEKKSRPVLLELIGRMKENLKKKLKKLSTRNCEVTLLAIKGGYYNAKEKTTGDQIATGIEGISGAGPLRDFLRPMEEVIMSEVLPTLLKLDVFLLTLKEKQVMEIALRDKYFKARIRGTNEKKIALELGIGQKTVTNNRRSAMEKIYKQIVQPVLEELAEE